MTGEEILALHEKYAPNDKQLKLVLDHCEIVSQIAIDCAKNTNRKVDIKLLKTAAMLHDIGSHVYSAAANNNSDYEKLYPLHAITGAKILKDEGLDRAIYEIVETHVLLGLTKEDIKLGGWALPLRNYEPKSVEGELLCYADRFHSKHPKFNSFDSFVKRLSKNLPSQAEKFIKMSKEFGIPNLDMLAKKYKHPIY